MNVLRKIKKILSVICVRRKEAKDAHNLSVVSHPFH